ncbi:MAG: hypothetical protein ACRDT6_02640 [Micromonosporaceae bacterium]
MSSSREVLRATAVAYEADIATAEYLIRKYAGGHSSRSASPARIINWVLRMSPDLLDTKSTALQELGPEGYTHVADTEALGDLRENWDGAGAKAFDGRWKDLGEHVGTEGDIGLRGNLDALVKDMQELTRKMEDFQTECAKAIETHLKGLREAYVSGLAHSGDGAEEIIKEKAAEYSLAGATLGGMGGAPGVGVGAGLGGVIGAIVGFVEANEAQARRLVEVRSDGATGGRVFGQTMEDLAKSLDVITPRKYGTNSEGRSEYPYIEGDEGTHPTDPGKGNAALDKGWE